MSTKRPPRSPQSHAATDVTHDVPSPSSAPSSVSAPVLAESPSAAPFDGDFTRVALIDVARRAGVSTATVSRVLNGTAIVREDKRTAVRKACEDLGYVINGAARALSSRRSKTIGAVVPTLKTQTFSRMLTAFQQRVHDEGYTLLLASSQFDPQLELQEVTNLLEHGIDALMVVGHTHDPKMWQRIARSRTPCIQTLSLDPDHPSLGFDNAEVGHQIADHLVALGHRCIGVIVGTPSTNDRVSERNAGIRKRLAEAGLTLPDDRVIADAFSLEESREAMLRLLAQPGDRPTAIICGNDLLAFGVLLAARASGLRVPEDVSIVGFNNYDFAAHLSPPLTTVSVDLVQVGTDSADYLMRELRGRPRIALPRVRTEFVIRGSTGPVPV
ncbi:LacI family DNA-binding transcriptional regulator [Robbsia andropogonis]|uniref:LacI family DNA-binding transcriptional regulator n=1 Tax=Robbsia andropogonis TaxID=28092 RepID=UPI002A6B1F82|nr:LacI family DNA-binding transcriptional regulator [Robbsia andropogonis]